MNLDARTLWSMDNRQRFWRQGQFPPRGSSLATAASVQSVNFRSLEFFSLGRRKCHVKDGDVQMH